MQKKLKTQTNLVRRKPSGIYYFRARVPSLLVPVLGKKVIFDSLKTTNKSEATAAAAKRRYEVQQELNRLKRAVPDQLGLQKRLFISEDEVRAICERYLVHMLAWDDELRFEGMSSSSSDLHLDILESHSDSVSASVARGDISFITPQLNAFLRTHIGIELDVSTLSYKKLAFEFLKTEAEAVRALLSRQRGEHVRTPKIIVGRTSFNALTEKWAILRSAEPKTKQSFMSTFDEFSTVHPGLFVETTFKSHVIQWRDALLNKEQAPKTIEKKLSFLRAAFNVAVENDWITTNPFKGVKAPVGSDKKPRIPFSIDDLHTIFNSKVFKGFRPKGGGREAAYWLPLLALYTGARLEELAQLRLEDVLEYEQLGWYLTITDQGEGASVKTKNGRRRVPIHNELHKFGFIEYVRTLKGVPDGYVFPDLNPDMYDDRGGNYSKWFGRYRRSIGVDDARKVFHSFRHGFIDACRECSISRETRDVLVGHTNPSVSSEYGSEKYPLVPLFEAMERIHYRGLDLTHLHRPNAV